MTFRGAAVLVATLVLAACARSGRETQPGNDPSRLVDTEEVESVLVATQRRSSPDLSVGPASCPRGVAAIEGATLECSVTVEGTPAPYRVTVRNGAGGGGGLRYDVRPAKAILLMSKVTEAIRQASSSPPEAVDCGPARVRIVEVGATFDCAVSQRERVSTVRVLVESLEGAVSFKET